VDFFAVLKYVDKNVILVAVILEYPRIKYFSFENENKNINYYLN